MSDTTNTTITPAVLTPRQAGAYLQVGTGCLAAWRAQGHGPRYLKLTPGRSGTVRYRLRDLDAYLDAAEVQH
ncbi:MULTISPECIES: helix-turn-helix domain-containing protein [Streptomyces]|uniref:helix-turn-helix domain-containing protein n=1 Tax=Streptomyces TaxID=1883 RepID=UPI0004CD9AE5|nr:MULTISPECIES: helix-turn-helix domain-containing protein [Streptomyces]